MAGRRSRTATKWVFDNIYKGSRIDHKPVVARALTPDVIVAHGVTVMETTNGMFDNRHSINTLILVRDGQSWRIATLHNTLADAGTTPPAR